MVTSIRGLLITLTKVPSPTNCSVHAFMQRGSKKVLGCGVCACVLLCTCVYVTCGECLFIRLSVCIGQI